MHPKYWKRPRVMASFDSEGSTGGAPAAEDFAAFFENSTPADDKDAPAPAAESQEDAAARLAAEDAAAEAGKTDPAEPAETDPNATAELQKFTFEVDGKPIELTAAEMAEHYKNGLRQKDYTQKTMAAAEETKAAQAEKTQARAAREEYAGKLDAFTQQANFELTALRSQLTNELLQSDPVAYLQIQRTAEERHAQLQQASRELEQINGQRQQEQAATLKSHMEAQHQALLDKLPEWKDQAKAEAEAAKIKQYLAAEGFKPEEMQFTDHRGILLARKAMQYDALMARAKETQTKVAAAVDVYVSDFGDIKFVPNRRMRTRDVAILQPDMWSVAYLRPFSTKNLAVTGDSTRKQIVVEYALEAKNPAANGAVVDIL